MSHAWVAKEMSGQKTQHMLHLSLPFLRKRVGRSLVYTGVGVFWRIRTNDYRRHKTAKTQDTWRIDRQGWGRQQRISLRFLCLGRLSVCMSLWTCLSLSLRDKTCLHHNCFNNRFRSWKLLCLLSFLVCFLSSFGCLIRLFVRLFWSFGRAARAHLVTLALTHNSASQLFLCPQLDLIFSLISDLFSRFFPLETVNFTARDS